MVIRDTPRSSTSNSSWPLVRAFCRRAGIFFAPLLGVVVLFEVALWRTGESWPLSRVVHAQLSLGQRPSLYGRLLFSQQFNLYKYEMIRRKRPRIIVHGTSRVMQVRDFMFHPLEPWFYNAGGMIQGPNDVATYARLVRTGDLPRPEVLIIGIDPWWVKEGAADQGWLDRESLGDVVWLFPAHIEAARLLLRRWAFPWKAVVSGVPGRTRNYPYQGIGAKPLLDGAGFRSDGSLQIEAEFVLESLHDPRYRDRHQILEMVTLHRAPFDLPTALDQSRMSVLLMALSELREMGVEVYAFLPPFASEVRSVFDSSSTWAPFWRAYQTDLPEHLRAAGIDCLPLSIPTRDGFNDTYMYDGYHPSEVYAAAIVRQIVQRMPTGSLLRQVDVAHLERLLSGDYATPLSFEKPPDQLEEVERRRNHHRAPDAVSPAR